MGSSLHNVFNYVQDTPQKPGLVNVFNYKQDSPVEKKPPTMQQQMKEVDKANNKAISTIDYIKTNEGYRDTIYNDTKGLKTIGYGFNLTDTETARLLPYEVVSGKRKITREEADLVFSKRLNIAMKDAISFMGGQENYANLTDSQKKGLIDMAYNLGLTRLNKFEKLREALFNGDKLRAKDEVLDSKYAREDVPNRALKNANLMLK